VKQHDQRPTGVRGILDVDLQRFREEFADVGYTIVRSLIDRTMAEELWEYVSDKAQLGMLPMLDSAVPGTPSVYADVTMERLLAALRPSIEDISGLELFETYSYYRVYKQGDTLKRHTDRPACEVSVTVNLGQQPAAPWPLGIEGRQGGRAYIELSAGDAVIYRGVECPHWRDAYPGERLGQVFLHYVSKNGQYKDWKYDRREALRLT
jgi:hypothetical protein